MSVHSQVHSISMLVLCLVNIIVAEVRVKDTEWTGTLQSQTIQMQNVHRISLPLAYSVSTQPTTSVSRIGIWWYPSQIIEQLFDIYNSCQAFKLIQVVLLFEKDLILRCFILFQKCSVYIHITVHSIFCIVYILL